MKIRATDIDNWSDKIESRGLLPELIRRLVFASCENLQECSFSAYEETARTGWDGTISCTRGNAWVPDGKSFWELGTNKDTRKKANEDYYKRNKVVPNATFVTVTSRNWRTKEKWLQEKKKNTSWHRLRLHDADDLAQWLASYPAVEAWLAEQMGKPCVGYQSVSTYWDILSSNARIKLEPAVFLISQQDVIKKLLEFLESGEPGVHKIASTSLAEVVDVVVAAIKENAKPENNLERLLSSSLVVTTCEALERLARETAPLCLILSPNLSREANLIVAAKNNGHSVIFGTPSEATPAEASSQISRQWSHELELALIYTGYPQQEARSLANRSRGSLVALKWLVGAIPQQPFDFDIDAVPLLWLDSADRTNAADCGVMAFLGNQEKHIQDYCDDLIIKHSVGDNPLLFRMGNVWSLLSKLVAWEVFRDYLTDTQFHKFIELAKSVLLSERVSFDRLYYVSRTYSPGEFSPYLVRSILDTLAMIATLNESGKLSNYWNESHSSITYKLQEIVELLLPEDAPLAVWQKYLKAMPTLAEISPNTLLSVLKKDLAKEKPHLSILLNELDNASSILWALERLSWSQQYFKETVEVLLAMAEIDDKRTSNEKQKIANRPANTLSGIYNQDNCYSTIPVNSRIAVLEGFSSQFPQAIRKISKYFRTSRQLFLEPDAPSWRDWADTWERRENTKVEYERQEEFFERHLATHVNNSPQDFWDALDYAFCMKNENQLLLAGEIKKFDLSSITEEKVNQLGCVLRKMVARNQSVEDKRYLADELVCAIQEKVSEIGNIRPALKYGWIFSAVPGSFCHFFDKEEWIEQYDEKSKEGFRLLLEEGGIEEVLELANIIEGGMTLGRLLAEQTEDRFLDRILPSFLTSTDKRKRSFACHFTHQRFMSDSWEWMERLPVEDWSTEQQFLFFEALPNEVATWKRLEELPPETQEMYWKENREYFSVRDDADELTYALKKFLHYDNLKNAFDLTDQSKYRKIEISAELYIEACEKLLPYDEWGTNVSDWQIQNVIELLDGNNSVPQERVARLALPLIDAYYHHTKKIPEKLTKRIDEVPDFFVKAVEYTFIEEKRNENEDEAKYFNSRWFFQYFDRIPGTSEDDDVDVSFLEKWLADAQKIAAERGCLSELNWKIAELFGKSIMKSIKAGESISNVILHFLENYSENGINSAQTAIYNSRGATMRSFTEGGAQEFTLYEKFFNLANSEEIAVPFPKVAEMFRNLAEEYRSQGSEEDKRVETHK